MIKTLCIFGTRPEAIKMAPIVRALNDHELINNKVCVTSQHVDLLHPVLKLFQIKPDFDLNVMTHNQNLTDLTITILNGLNNVFESYMPDLVIVHGDTTTTLAASLSSFYHKIRLAHVEAGLRSGNLSSPWPEEMNRKLTDAMTTLYFAPTELARNNLLKEGVPPNNIFVTGNTAVDALLQMDQKISADQNLQNSFKQKFSFLNSSRKRILVTGHRRESFGQGFINICTALADIATLFPEIDIVYPVHPNPNVQKPVNERLKRFNNIHLIPPLDYDLFVFFMKSSYLILTDSGGIQEEAPSLHIPVLVMRENTERIEGIKAGAVIMVGTKISSIMDKVTDLLTNTFLYDQMTHIENPYGDGKASQRIVSTIAKMQLKPS